MAVIRIREEDNTTSTTLADIYDITYIPGFGDLTVEDDPGNKPVTCYSLSQFQKYFGKKAPVFTEGSEIMFRSSSTSDEYTMIYSKDELDPSYVMASELIASGMPVCYERVNQTSDVNTKLENMVWEDKTCSIYETAFDSPLYTGESFIKHVTIKSGTDDVTSLITMTYVPATEAVPNATYTLVWDDETEPPVTLQFLYKKNPGVTAEMMYEALLPSSTSGTSILEKLKDRGTFTLKYITTGGYPSFEFYRPDNGTESNYQLLFQELLQVAGSLENEDSVENTSGRGDAIALIDHCYAPTRPLIGTGSVDEVLENINDNDLLQFAAMFTPWCEYSTSSVANINSLTETFALPASFAYLKAVAKLVKAGNDNWYAVANISRGAVDLDKQLTSEILTNSIANAYQKDVDTGEGCSQNAITYVNPYGYCIWGNRTLKKADGTGITATGFLNMRTVLCDIKKVIYQSAKRYMFEPNTETLWLNFSTRIANLLEDMKASSAISDYSIKKDKEKSVKTKLYAQIVIYPVYAVETFDISIDISDEDVTISGV